MFIFKNSGRTIHLENYSNVFSNLVILRNILLLLHKLINDYKKYIIYINEIDNIINSGTCMEILIEDILNVSNIDVFTIDTRKTIDLFLSKFMIFYKNKLCQESLQINKTIYNLESKYSFINVKKVFICTEHISYTDINAYPVIMQNIMIYIQERYNIFNILDELKKLNAFDNSYGIGEKTQLIIELVKKFFNEFKSIININDFLQGYCFRSNNQWKQLKYDYLFYDYNISNLNITKLDLLNILHFIKENIEKKETNITEKDINNYLNEINTYIEQSLFIKSELGNLFQINKNNCIYIKYK